MTGLRVLMPVVELAGWLAGAVVAIMALLSTLRQKNLNKPRAAEGPSEALKDTASQLRVRVAAESGAGLRLVQNLGDNPVCTVTVDESIPAIVLTWRRYVTSSQLRFIHEAILELICNRGLRLILADSTDLPTILEEDQHWIVEDWIPRARVAGVRATATKLPAARIGRLAVAQIAARVPWKLRAFGDILEARQWLQGQVH